jgi:hypothetical protein
LNSCAFQKNETQQISIEVSLNLISVSFVLFLLICYVSRSRYAASLSTFMRAEALAPKDFRVKFNQGVLKNAMIPTSESFITQLPLVVIICCRPSAVISRSLHPSGGNSDRRLKIRKICSCVRFFPLAPLSRIIESFISQVSRSGQCL